MPILPRLYSPLRTLIFLRIYILLTSSPSHPLSFHRPPHPTPFPQDAPALFTCLLLARSLRIYPPSFLEFNSTDCCQNRRVLSDEDADTIANYSPHTPPAMAKPLELAASRCFAMVLQAVWGVGGRTGPHNHTCSRLPQVGDPTKDAPKGSRLK